MVFITRGTNGANFPVKDCRFISCVANGRTPSNGNDADGGGLIFWENTHTFGINNALFVNCESKNRAGGSFVVINSYYFKHIIRFCFYCDNTAPKGRNAPIHFNGTDGTPWSIIFFHSFTSDNSITNSLVKNYSDGTPVLDNWIN